MVAYLGFLTTRAKSYVRWTINMLVSQIYDSDLEVSRFAILILDNLCQRDGSIAIDIVKCRPIFINVLESAFSLMTRLLAVPSGFDFLSKLTFIESQLVEWNKVRLSLICSVYGTSHFSKMYAAWKPQVCYQDGTFS